MAVVRGTRKKAALFGAALDGGVGRWLWIGAQAGMPVLLEGYWRSESRTTEREPMAKKIKVKVFDELRESLQDALAFETIHLGIYYTDLRVTELPPPPPSFTERYSRDPTFVERQPSAVCAVLEREPQYDSKLGTRHAAAAGGGFEAARDRENESSCVIENLRRLVFWTGTSAIDY